MKTVITEAMDTLRTALGLKTNCTCEGATMKPNEISTLAAKLATNGADLGGIKALAKLKTNFDIAELTKMDEAGRTALAAALKALDKAQAKQAAEDPEKDPLETEADPEADPIDNEDEDKDRPANNRRAARGAVTMSDLTTMIRKVVRNEVGAMRTDLLTAGRRADVTARLMANQRNAFDEAELQTMSVDQLDKYERSIRDADYSGAAGGFVAHSGDDSPLVPPAGLLAPRKAN